MLGLYDQHVHLLLRTGTTSISIKAGIRLTSDERILGSSSFVEKTLANAGEDYDRRMRLKASGIDLDVVTGVVASHLGVNKTELCSTSRRQ